MHKGNQRLLIFLFKLVNLSIDLFKNNYFTFIFNQLSRVRMQYSRLTKSEYDDVFFRSINVAGIHKKAPDLSQLAYCMTFVSLIRGKMCSLYI